MIESKTNKKIKLTNNEKKVLRKIIEEGRIADTDMAKSMNLSQQGIFRIRRKLEDSGIIEGYYPNINFKKIGINLIQVLGVKVNPIVWKTEKESDIASQLKKIPYLFHAYRITGYDITYMITLGFKNIHQKDHAQYNNNKYSGMVQQRIKRKEKDKGKMPDLSFTVFNL